ncbi:MAG: hypothetical protein PHI97_25580 [Desulfobulbus sp.]|nr:hypothetical protein [Desulfobulbus sp.]
MNISTVKFKGNDIDVRELTVSQLDEVMGDIDKLTMIDRVFNPDMVTEKMLALSTGLPTDELRSSTPSDLRVIVETFKDVNTDFLAGVRSLTGEG